MEEMAELSMEKPTHLWASPLNMAISQYLRPLDCCTSYSVCTSRQPDGSFVLKVDYSGDLNVCVSQAPSFCYWPAMNTNRNPLLMTSLTHRHLVLIGHGILGNEGDFERHSEQ